MSFNMGPLQAALTIFAITVGIANSTPVGGENPNCNKILDKIHVDVLETGIYRFPTQELTWTQSKQYCFNPVRIESSREAELVFNAATKGSNDSAQFWTLGTNRARLDRNFVWAIQVPGTPVDNSLWLPGEPSVVNGRTEGQCIGATLRKGGLADADCNEIFRTICEEPLGKSCEQILGDLSITTLETGTYLFSKKFYKWNEADEYCKGFGMELPVLVDINEIKIVYKEANSRYPETVRFWIGGAEKGVKGEFFWANNEPVDPKHWVPGHPAHTKETDPACITLRSKGIGDCPCNVGRRVVCKLPN